MVGMLQILTYLLAFYLVMKGVQILQTALASPLQHRKLILTIGLLSLLACIAAAILFVNMQDTMASRVHLSQ